MDQNIQADQPMEMEEAQNGQTNETHQQNCQITLRSLTGCMEQATQTMPLSQEVTLLFQQ